MIYLPTAIFQKEGEQYELEGKKTKQKGKQNEERARGDG